MKKSKLWKLDKNDFFKGLITSVIMAIIAGLYQITQTGGEFSMATLKVVGLSALGAGFAYIMKNFATNSNDQVLMKDSTEPPTPPIRP